jgi:hypothetical protein
MPFEHNNPLLFSPHLCRCKQMVQLRPITISLNRGGKKQFLQKIKLYMANHKHIISDSRI